MFITICGQLFHLLQALFMALHRGSPHNAVRGYFEDVVLMRGETSHFIFGTSTLGLEFNDRWLGPVPGRIA